MWKNVEEDDGKPTEKEIARAAFSWLKRIHRDPLDQPFKGQMFYLECQASRAAAFKRLILAGGGEVVDSKDDATIILTQSNPKVTHTKNGIPIENVNYLSAAILEIDS